MSDYYTESQMQRIEQAAYDGAMLEAGKEWERQRGEFGATEAELQSRITELEQDLSNKETEYTDLWDDALALQSRIAELEAENNRLAELLHNELSSVEIATDLGNKRWVALNDIYENGEKHNANWCKRKAQEGLGIK